MRAVAAAVVAGWCITLPAVSVAAAEPTTELSAGGLAYSGHLPLVTQKEDIAVSHRYARASYVVRNTGETPLSTLMAFALPDVDMLALDGTTVENPAFDPQNPANFVGFSGLIDGKAVETFVETRALALGLLDVTAKLRDLGLPLYPLHPDLPDKLTALPEAAKVELAKQGLVRLSEGQWEPLWVLKSTLYWMQDFAAGQSRTITIGYRPIAGSGPWTADTAAALQSRYCVPAAVVSGLTQKAAAGEAATVRWVHYLAYAGASARGAAASYRVTLEAEAGKQTAYTCRSGLTGGVTGTRETGDTDRVSDDEIQVLFVE